MPHHLLSKKYVASFLGGASIVGTTGFGLLHSRDYADPKNPKLEAHTSLNHDLAQMNFLYEYYLMTNH